MWNWLKRLIGQIQEPAPAAPEQAETMWNSNFSARLQAFVRVHPVPQRLPAEAQEPAFEDRCRAWVKKLAQHFAFYYGPAWGVKSSSPGAPQSKDVLALHGSDQLHGWDMLAGAGTGFPVLNDPPSPIPDHEMKPQTFIPVTPKNWLAEPLPDPQPDPQPDPVPDPQPEPEPAPGNLAARVAALEARVAQYDAVIRALRAL